MNSKSQFGYLSNLMTTFSLRVSEGNGLYTGISILLNLNRMGLNSKIILTMDLGNSENSIPDSVYIILNVFEFEFKQN